MMKRKTTTAKTPDAASAGTFCTTDAGFTPKVPKLEDEHGEVTSPSTPPYSPLPEAFTAPGFYEPISSVDSGEAFKRYAAKSGTGTSPVKTVKGKMGEAKIVILEEPLPGESTMLIQAIFVTGTYAIKDFLFPTSEVVCPDGFSFTECPPVIRSLADIKRRLRCFCNSPQVERVLEKEKSWLFFSGIPYRDATVMRDLTSLGYEEPTEQLRLTSRVPSGVEDDASEAALVAQQQRMRKVANALKSFDGFCTTIATPTGGTRTVSMKIQDVKKIKFGPEYSSDNSGDGPERKRCFTVRKCTRGVAIATITTDCTAYINGLRPGHIITHVNGNSYSGYPNIECFYEDALLNQNDLSFIDKMRDVTITPCTTNNAQTSFNVRATTRGLTVTSIRQESAAYRSGLRSGSLITHVLNVPYSQYESPQQFYNDALLNENDLAFDTYIDSDDEPIQKRIRSEEYKRKHCTANQKANLSGEQIKRNNINAKKRKEKLFESLRVEWEFDNPCPHCQFVHYKGSSKEFRSQCCLNGTAFIALPKLHPLPTYITRRVLDPDYYEHFVMSASYYNNQLALAAVKVDNGKGGGWEKIKGPHNVKLNGRTMHFLPQSQCGALHYFTFDALPTLRQAADRVNCDKVTDGMRIIDNFLTEFYCGLQHTNPIVQECEQIGRFANSCVPPPLGKVTEINIEMQNPVHHFEVACVVGVNPGDLRLQYKLKNMRSGSEIPSVHPLYEPLSYPLLFPYGEYGWSSDLNHNDNITLMKYLCCRMLMPESDLFVMSQDGKRMLQLNRFQLLSRLGQTYLVDNMSRIIDIQLNHTKRKQQPNFAEAYDSSAAKTFLGSSFFGGRRHLKEQAQNALTIVSELGPPTMFITLTCNPKWPDIIERIGFGDSAYSRPDVTCMVFHERLRKILHNIRHGKYFPVPDGGLKYEIRVIEYQYRGLPHCHLVICDPYAPPKNDVEGVQKYIDSRIHACFPTEASGNEEYINLIKHKMLHKCSNGPNGCMNQDGSCDARFDRTICSQYSFIDEKGYPQYKRPLERDLMVVPHIRSMLEDWDGHANVEYCGSCATIIYLYKYLFKGSKKERFRLKNADDVADDDEIGQYIRARVMTSSDCMWRILGYQTYPATNPQVIVVKSSTEKEIADNLDNGKLCDILVYFNRPQALESVTFTELYSRYLRGPSLPRWASDDNKNISWYHLHIPGYEKDHFLYVRVAPDQVICRLGMIPLSAGEPFYLRQLMMHRSARKFEDFRTIDSQTCNTYQEACQVLGIIERKEEAKLCLQQNLLFATSSELRSLFVMLTVQGFPTIAAYNDNDIRSAMALEFSIRRNESVSNSMVVNDMLTDLEDRFVSMGKNMGDYGLPLPLRKMTELQRECMRYNFYEQEQLFNDLNAQFPNNPAQQEVMSEVMEVLEAPGISTLIFIQGQAGTGKTNLGRKILSYVRSKGHLAFAIASTGLAANLYDNGMTAHSFFGVDVRNDDDIEDDETRQPVGCWRLKGRPEREELIQNTKCILWDEFPSNHSEVFNAAYTYFGGFKGKIVVCMGDFKQIPPVVKYGVRKEVVNASIMSHYLWDKFAVYELTTNMRLQIEADRLRKLISESNADEADVLRLTDQLQYGNMLLAIGRGVTHETAQLLDEDTTSGRQLLRLPRVQYFIEEERDAAINFVFADGFDPENISRRHILVATNALGDEWNSIIQHYNPNEMHELLSSDKLADVDDPHNILASMLTQEVLNMYDSPGVPPHKLELKVNDICIVLRNLSRKDKIATNTIVRITRITNICITAETLGDHRKRVLIPRIYFKFKLPYGRSFSLLRRQFPLRLAYAITLNKSQGQEGKAFLFDARSPPFTMGHAYVGLSRVFSSSSIAIFLSKEQVLDNAPTMVNVVYPEMLTQHDKIAAKEQSINKIKYDTNHLNAEVAAAFKLEDMFIPFKKRILPAKEQAERLALRSLTHRNELYKLSMGDYDSIVTSTEHIDPLHDRLEILNHKLHSLGLQYCDVPRDGNCLFHAILHVLQQSSDYPWKIPANALQFRLDAVAALRNQQNNFFDRDVLTSQFTHDYDDTEFDIMSYCDRMEREGTYADHAIIVAVSFICNIRITIVQHDGEYTINAYDEDEFMYPVTIGAIKNVHFVSVTRL